VTLEQNVNLEFGGTAWLRRHLRCLPRLEGNHAGVQLDGVNG
jgi:hypothetical protein